MLEDDVVLLTDLSSVLVVAVEDSPALEEPSVRAEEAVVEPEGPEPAVDEGSGGGLDEPKVSIPVRFLSRFFSVEPFQIARRGLETAEREVPSVSETTKFPSSGVGFDLNGSLLAACLGVGSFSGTVGDPPEGDSSPADPEVMEVVEVVLVVLLKGLLRLLSSLGAPSPVANVAETFSSSVPLEGA
jgi:hypothetical protein